ncbi:MAG: hypothetical protein CM15mV32_0900 [Caudoviricetes sp.]|nr:MAG: hypothetical protein CM15mV32_0900 [Caudoviricetes sp.]
MQIKHDVKGQLARLLATEDLIVEHRSVDTASFNVQTRVLTLPTWEKAGEEVYDTLVCHEVGHALYTPDVEWWINNEISASIVNIVEDARIEKLMKRRYAGLSKTFFRGYSSLSEDDFFQLKNKDLTKFNLADRINLYYKVGNFVDIPFFNNEETFLMNRTGLTETFDDVLEVAKLIFEYCKAEAEKQRQEAEQMKQDTETEGSLDNNTTSGQSNSGEPSMEEDGDGGEDGEEQEMQVTQSSNSGGSNTTANIQGGEESGEIEAQTDEMFTDSLKELSNPTSEQTYYVELPKVNLKHFIIDNQKIHDDMIAEWTDEQNNATKDYIARNPDYKTKPTEEICFREYTYNPFNLFEHSDTEFNKFKKDAQKEVNYLVKEFECKKSAAAYARATTSRTGILDTAVLHTYKFNEDLFKKVSVVPDGKNHGLIFILDWSGSMQNVMMDTIKQLFNLVWFCKKVNIPFEVYAFTNSYPNPNRFDIVQEDLKMHMDGNFALLNLLTSKTRAKDMNEQMRNVFRLAFAFDRRGAYYRVPLGMSLSGTPLNEALICLHQILPQFRKENGLQKVQCVVLTDGEAQSMRFNREISREWEEGTYMGSAYLNDSCYIRNRKTGYVYGLKNMGYYGDATDVFLEDLRQSFPETNFIGIRLMPNGWASSFIQKYTDDTCEYEKSLNHWRKHKSISLKTSGYHVYFGLSSTSLGNDTEFEVQEDATKAQIKKAFNKSLKNKKMNKKILGEFIELVA